MDSVEELYDHIKKHIPTFQNLEIILNGVAYHYTNHWDKIEAAGYFLGAKIDGELDKTQWTLPSEPAIYNPGVVFAYQFIEDAIEEGGVVKIIGFSTDIIKIHYIYAIKGTHIQEAALGAPDTIMILTSDIERFRHVRKLA